MAEIVEFGQRRAEMRKMISTIASIVFMMLIVFGMIWCFINAPEGIEGDFSTKIEVAKPNEIKNAVSNIVANLEKRDFVPVYLGVKWHPASKTYAIYARGIDRANLDKYEP